MGETIFGRVPADISPDEHHIRREKELKDYYEHQIKSLENNCLEMMRALDHKYDTNISESYTETYPYSGIDFFNIESEKCARRIEKMKNRENELLSLIGALVMVIIFIAIMAFI